MAKKSSPDQCLMWFGPDDRPASRLTRLGAGFPLIVQAAWLEAECWLSLTHDLRGELI